MDSFCPTETTMTTLHSVRNIGISAHIDSGKTTLSERILFYTGRIHKITEVKDKSGDGATLDFDSLEKAKGITIQSATTTVAWNEHTIHLIDTPGHVDFTIEVERALRVLDGAVLVLCAVAGVQSQSYTVERQMRRYRVPRIAFINKLDRPGADPRRVVRELKEKLQLHPIVTQIPIGLEREHEGVVDLLTERAFYFDGENGEIVRESAIPPHLVAEATEARQRLVEAVAEVDAGVAAKFIDDLPIAVDELIAAIRTATLSLRATPVFLGSALANKGVQLLLDGVVAYLPHPGEVEQVAFTETGAEMMLSADPTLPLVGLVFKIDEDRFGQLAWVRLYQGRIEKGQFVSIQGRRTKVSRLLRLHANRHEEIHSANAGDIVAVVGLSAESGNTVTDGAALTLTSMFVPEGVVSLAIAPKHQEKAAAFSKGLGRFLREDPTLRIKRDPESGETLLIGMGELHLDITIAKLERDFDCEVVTGPPRVNYRETIRRTSAFDYTHRKQDGGHGQYARVAGRLEPVAADFEFVDKTVGGSIPRQFVPACEKGFVEAMRRGPLVGAPIVGVRCVISDGAAHSKDSSEIAFRTASLMGFRAAYRESDPIVLEPIMRVEVEVPSEFQGAILGQLAQRRGSISSSEGLEGVVRTVAEVPLAEMFQYALALRSASQGKGVFTMEFLRYAEVPGGVAARLG